MNRCGICGFEGEPDRYIPHDCYWVLRERGVTALQHLQQRLKEPVSVGAVDRQACSTGTPSTREKEAIVTLPPPEQEPKP